MKGGSRVFASWNSRPCIQKAPCSRRHHVLQTPVNPSSRSHTDAQSCGPYHTTRTMTCCQAAHRDTCHLHRSHAAHVANLGQSHGAPRGKGGHTILAHVEHSKLSIELEIPSAQKKKKSWRYPITGACPCPVEMVSNMGRAYAHTTMPARKSSPYNPHRDG